MENRREVDAEVRRLCEIGDVHGATTHAIRGMGRELLGFLALLCRDPQDAGDVFTDLCVRIWRGLPAFRWDSSLRTWAYVLARRAFHAHRRRHADWGERRVGLSDARLDAEIAEIRTSTLARLAAEPKTRVQRLRERLEPDEQALLTLRIDRDLDWAEVAVILADEDIADDAAAIDRASAQVRKRFERLKDRLRRLAAEDDGPA